MHIDEKQLVLEAKKGNAESLGALFEKFRPKLHANALRWLGHGTEAKDAVQETYITAFAKIHQLRDPNAIEGWLQTILKNHCRMMLRDRKHISCGDGMSHFLSQAQIESSIEKQMEQTHLKECIHTAVMELPQKLRMTTLLRYFSNYNAYQEIAEILDIPLNTVRSRISQSRSQLEGKIRKSGEKVNDTHHRLNKLRSVFYKEAWASFYEGNREYFLKHYDKDLKIRFSSGKIFEGRNRWAEEWNVDLRSGVRFKPTHIIACPEITLVEGPIFNPPDDPYHCPPAGSFVHFHKKGKTQRVHIHYAEWK